MSKHMTPATGKKGTKKRPPARSPRSRIGKKGAEPGKAASPGDLNLRVGARSIPLAISTLDQKAIGDIGEQLGQATLKSVLVEVVVGDPTPWSRQDTERFWDLYRGVRGADGQPVTLRVGGKVFGQPGEWAAGVLASTTDRPEDRCRALDLAADILANVHLPREQEVYLDAIVATLTGRGYAKSYGDEVRRQVRQRLREHTRNASGGKAASGGCGGASDLARLFLADHYLPAADQGSSGDAARAHRPTYQMRYYGESFYRRRPGVWVQATAEDIRLEVTTFLQSATHAATSSAVNSFSFPFARTPLSFICRIIPHPRPAATSPRTSCTSSPPACRTG